MWQSGFHLKMHFTYDLIKKTAPTQTQTSDITHIYTVVNEAVFFMRKVWLTVSKFLYKLSHLFGGFFSDRTKLYSALCHIIIYG